MHTIEPITLNALLSRAWIAPSLLTFLYMILNVADLQREINTLMGSIVPVLRRDCSVVEVHANAILSAQTSLAIAANAANVEIVNSLIQATTTAVSKTIYIIFVMLKAIISLITGSWACIAQAALSAIGALVDIVIAQVTIIAQAIVNEFLAIINFMYDFVAKTEQFVQNLLGISWSVPAQPNLGSVNLSWGVDLSAVVVGSVQNWLDDAIAQIQVFFDQATYLTDNALLTRQISDGGIPVPDAIELEFCDKVNWSQIETDVQLATKIVQIILIVTIIACVLGLLAWEMSRIYVKYKIWQRKRNRLRSQVSKWKDIPMVHSQGKQAHTPDYRPIISSQSPERNAVLRSSLMVIATTDQTPSAPDWNPFELTRPIISTVPKKQHREFGTSVGQSLLSGSSQRLYPTNITAQSNAPEQRAERPRPSNIGQNEHDESIITAETMISWLDASYKLPGVLSKFLKPGADRRNWYLQYIWHPPALMVLLFSVMGLLCSVLQIYMIQYAHDQYVHTISPPLEDFVLSTNTSMWLFSENLSADFAAVMNAMILDTTVGINTDLLGPIANITSAMNAGLLQIESLITQNVQNFVSASADFRFSGSTLIPDLINQLITCLIVDKLDKFESVLVTLQNISMPLVQVDADILVPRRLLLTIDEVGDLLLNSTVGIEVQRTNWYGSSYNTTSGGVIGDALESIYQRIIRFRYYQVWMLVGSLMLFAQGALILASQWLYKRLLRVKLRAWVSTTYHRYLEWYQTWQARVRSWRMPKNAYQARLTDSKT